MSYVAAAKPFLSAKNISERLSSYAERQQWTLQKWQSVAFTDEASLALRPLRN